MTNLPFANILLKHVTIICNRIKVVLLKFHRTSASIVFIKKVTFNELTVEFAIVKGQCVTEKTDRSIAQLIS